MSCFGGISFELFCAGCNWCSCCVVACRAEPSGCTVDRPTVDRGAHRTPAAGLASPKTLSQTLQVHSASQIAPDLQHAAIAAEDPRTTGSIGTRSKSPPKTVTVVVELADLDHFAATREEPILRNGPI